jgi:hypothetical protein
MRSEQRIYQSVRKSVVIAGSQEAGRGTDASVGTAVTTTIKIVHFQ